jgi:hypothetical protein
VSSPPARAGNDDELPVGNRAAYLDSTQSVTVFGGVNRNGATERFQHLSALTTATELGGSCGAGFQRQITDALTLGA